MTLNINETKKLRDAMGVCNSVALTLQKMIDDRPNDEPITAIEIENQGSMMEMIRTLKKTQRDLHEIWSKKGKFSG